MKKTKLGLKLTALLLVIFMLTLSSIPAYAAYDPTIKTTPDGSPPADEWTVISVYHWVVRGETLQGIADRYGTNIDEIKFYNNAYFEDLANRNTTTTLSIQVEHGVRLFIYHMVRVRHYVVRGDILSGLANGSLTYGSFTLRTTPAAIIAENYKWFDDLAKLNKTRNVEHELNESYDFWDVDYNDFAGFDHRYNRYVTSDGYVYEAYENLWAGTPLFITVPVQIRVDPLEPLYLRETYTFMRDNGEKVGNPVLTDPTQIPFPNTMWTNSYLPTNSGWTRAVGYPRQALRLGNYKIPGWYGNLASDGGKWW